MKSRDRKARKRRFAMLPLDLLTHESVTTLDHAPHRVLVLLASQYHGHNNGAIGLSARQAAQLGIKSDNTFYDALKELQSRGLILLTAPASRVPPRPAMFALAWQSIDDTQYSQSTKTPPLDYQEWRP